MFRSSENLFQSQRLQKSLQLQGNSRYILLGRVLVKVIEDYQDTRILLLTYISVFEERHLFYIRLSQINTVEP